MNKERELHPELKQAIELHLRLDEKFGYTDRRFWPRDLAELYEKTTGQESDLQEEN